jgi:hypothetical protein
MDIVKNRANEYANRIYIWSGYIDPDEVIQNVNAEVYKIRPQADKIKYLTTFLERNSKSLQEHEIKCIKKGDCELETNLHTIAYFLNQELETLGVIIDSNAFSSEEKLNLENRLDGLLKDNEQLRNGQEILFNELQELKNLFYLGKKNWWQLLLGKTGEMVAGGIIGETLSKQIVEALKPSIKSMIG